MVYSFATIMPIYFEHPEYDELMNEINSIDMSKLDDDGDFNNVAGKSKKRLKTLIKMIGIPITLSKSNLNHANKKAPGVGGYTVWRHDSKTNYKTLDRICIKTKSDKKTLKESAMIRILFHELAHGFMHGNQDKSHYYREGSKSLYNPDEVITNGYHEIEADAVSYLVCKELGITSHDSIEYIRGYIEKIGNHQIQKFKIVSTANKILEHIKYSKRITFRDFEGGA